MKLKIIDRADELGLSGATIARRAGIARNTWYRRMRGGGWTLAELHGVADVLEMDPADLLGRGAAA